MSEEKQRVSLIAAIGKNRELGKTDELLWHIPDDLKRFRKLTLGHPVIMGRKTYESIFAYLKKPLPDRTNIVVTRSNLCIDGCLVYHSLHEALRAAYAVDTEEVFIIGGGEIYTQALPLADRLYLTLVDDERLDADTFFPDYRDFTKVVEKEEREHNGLKYEWVTLDR